MAFIWLGPVVAAILFWRTATAGAGKGAQVLGRATYKNASSTSTSSHSSTITSPPFVPPSSFDLMDCPEPNTIFMGFNCYRSGSPDAGFDFRSPYNTTLYPYNIVPPDDYIATYCGELWTSTASVWLSTAIVMTDGPSNVFYADTSSNQIGSGEPGAFTWKPSTPCCLNCTILGGTVQVMVWPTSTLTPGISTLINKSNYTFVSPSIYAVFQSLAATDMCGQAGSIYLNKTLAFAPSELSTASSIFANEDDEFNNWFCKENSLRPYKWLPFNYLDDELGECKIITTTWWSYIGEGGSSYSQQADMPPPTNPAEMANSFECLYNPCSPFLSVPPQIYSVDPAFQGCLDGINAFIDPPYFLTPGNGLTPFTTTSNSPPTSSSLSSSSSSAAPGPSPAPDMPIQTSATNSVASTTTTPSDPPQQTGPASDPGDPNNQSASSSTPTDDNASPDPPAQADSSTTQASPALPAAQPSASPDAPKPLDITTSPNPQASAPAQTNAVPATPNSPSPAASVTIAGQVVTQDMSSNFVLGTQTLAPGGSALSISGTTYSLPTSGNAIVVDGTTSLLPVPAAQTPTSPAAIATIAGQVVTQDSSSNFVLGTQTLAPGGSAVVISGTTYSLLTSENGVVVDETTSLLPVPTQPTVWISTASDNEEYAIVGTQTLTPGGSAVAISGTTYSLPTSGNDVVVNGKTSPLPTLAGPESGLWLSTEPNNKEYAMVGTQTLTPGGPAVAISGTTYSIATTGMAIIVNGVSEYLVGSQTLKAGGPLITISGTVLSLQAGGQTVVVGATTEAVSVFLTENPALLGLATGISQGLGGVIASLGGFATPTSTPIYTGTSTSSGYNGIVYTGAASRSRTDLWWIIASTSLTALLF